MGLKALGAVLAGALLLAWPAFLNGYPLVFSDTGAFLHQTLGPLMIWDKPWIYGPLAFLLHGHVSLWPVVLGQGLVMSHLLWLVLRAFGGGARPGRHLLLCGTVAALTALPFTVSLVMPDVLTPAVLLCALLLAFGRRSLSRAEAAWLAVLGALGTAAHLSHLPMMGALLLVASLGGWRAAGRVAAPLLGAVALLLATNLAGHGRLSLSPYGSTFLMARLIANGPGLDTIEAACPGTGWALCAFRGPGFEPFGPRACLYHRCPRDLLPSDILLWHPDSPINRDETGQPRDFGGRALSREAGDIIRATAARDPLGVAWGGVRDTLTQLLLRNRVGDTLERHHIGEGVLGRIQAFSPEEAARFEAGAQWRGALPGLVAPLLWVQGPVLVLGALALAVLGWRARRDPAARGFALGIAIGLLANAFATGALSGPHDRYGARVAWIVVAGAFALGAAARTRRAEAPPSP